VDSPDDGSSDTAPIEHPLEQALAVPAGTDVLALARDWFADAERLEEPGVARARLGGGRLGSLFGRGASASPGLLQVAPGVRLRGPQARASVAQRLPHGLEDVYLVEARAGEEGFSAWCHAVARRCGGAVVDASGAVVTPARHEVVGLTLFAPSQVSAGMALVHARTVAPGARAVDVVGAESYELAVDTPYDGTVWLSFARRRVLPVALTWLPDETYGSFAYELSWVPPNAGAASPDSVVGRVARERVVPLLARLTAVIQAHADGTVVDAGGFVVPIEDLRRLGSV
jgi:hypothetical protein